MKKYFLNFVAAFVFVLSWLPHPQLLQAEEGASIKNIKVQCPYGLNLRTRVNNPTPRDQEFIDAYDAPDETLMNEWINKYKFRLETPRGTNEIPDEMRITFLGLFYYRLEKYSKSEAYLKKACEEKSQKIACLYINILKQFVAYPAQRSQIRIKLDLCGVGDLHADFLAKHKAQASDSLAKLNEITECKDIPFEHYLTVPNTTKYFYSKINNVEDFPQLPFPLKNYVEINRSYLLEKWNWEKFDFDAPFEELLYKPTQMVRNFCKCTSAKDSLPLLNNLVAPLNSETLTLLKKALPEKSTLFSDQTILIDVQDNPHPKIILFPFSCASAHQLPEPQPATFFLEQQKEEYMSWGKRQLAAFQMEQETTDIMVYRERLKKLKISGSETLRENEQKREYYYNLSQKLLDKGKITKIQMMDFKVEIKRQFLDTEKVLKIKVAELTNRYEFFLKREYGPKADEVGDPHNPFKMRAPDVPQAAGDKEKPFQ